MTLWNLPASDASLPGSPDPTTASSPAPSLALWGKRVVIVEDEGITQMMLARILSRAGLVVVDVASNGPDGVVAALREKPDLVLMDIRMPGAYDGMEATRRILAELPTCVLLLTANDDAHYRETALALGTCGYIVKPVTAASLMPELVAAWERWGTVSS